MELKINQEEKVKFMQPNDSLTPLILILLTSTH